MPYIVQIAPADTMPLNVPDAAELADIERGLHAQVPDGWELAGISVSMPRGDDRMVGTGIARPLERREITIEQREQLWTDVPEGWRALSIREA